MPAEYDPYGLDRFLEAQESAYDRALAEIKSGRKRTHWMWYIFPQIDGLGASANARHYAIRSIDEAEAYLSHPVLGPRLLECADAVVNLEGLSVADVFGSPDDMKLRSCASFSQSLSENS